MATDSPSPPQRRFQIVDAMVLVAATAAGLLSLRYDSDPEGNVLGVWYGIFVTLACLGLAWTFALMLLRLRRPRPTLAGVASQPGFAAGIATLTWFLFEGATYVADGQLIDGFVWDLGDFLLPPNGLAIAILAVWGALGLSGGLRPEASWVDRAGRGLGGFWVGMWLSYAILWAVTL